MIASGMTSDFRRKLLTSDYNRIKFQVNVLGYTIRETATEFGVSTKYVVKILDGVAGNYVPPIPPSPSCSGCGRSFDYSGLSAHYILWTSGNIHDLWCLSGVPNGWRAGNRV